MPAEDFQGLRIYTASPAPTATLDTRVGITDSTGTRTWKIDASDRGEISLFASGSAIGAVSNALRIDISSQALAGVKLSRDGLTPATTNANYAEVVTAGALLAADNPLAAQLSQGGVVLSVTNGLFSNVLQGNAVLTPANGLPVRLTDGDAFNDAANPVLAALSLGGTAVSSTNPLPVNLVNPQVTGTPVYPYDESATEIAQGATSTHTVTPGVGLDLYVALIACTAPGYAHFVIKRGAVIVAKVRTTPTEQTKFIKYPEDEPLKMPNGTNLVIERTNDGKDDMLLTSWAVGFEKAP